jgi:hypothetical protein
MTDMLRLYKDFGDSREQVDHIFPGDAGAYGEAAQDVSRLILFGCFDSDLGGEVRIIDRQFYESTPNHASISDEFLDQTKLLETIAFCGRVEFALSEGAERPGLLVVEHVPGHYN